MPPHRANFGLGVVEGPRYGSNAAPKPRGSGHHDPLTLSSQFDTQGVLVGNWGLKNRVYPFTLFLLTSSASHYTHRSHKKLTVTKKVGRRRNDDAESDPEDLTRLRSLDKSHCVPKHNISSHLLTLHHNIQLCITICNITYITLRAET